MPITNEQLLEKATFTTSDLTSAGISVDAADGFISKLIAPQEMLSDVRVVRHNEAKWQEAFIDFASRIARPLTEYSRLADADRTEPTTSFVEFSPVGIKGEVVISDEALEDALGGGSRFENQLVDLIAQRFGQDTEDLLLNGDTASADTYLALDDGWLKLARGAGGHVVSASGVTSPSAIMASLYKALPDRWKRNLTADGRYYCSYAFEQAYREELQARGTALGDSALTGSSDLRFQNIPLNPVTTWPEVVPDTNPDTTYVLLTNRNNLYAAFRRVITLETFRDPREGGTSFIVTARVDAEIGEVDATAIATAVNNETL